LPWRQPKKLPNEARKLTFRLDQKPGDRHEARKLTFRLDQKPGDRQTEITKMINLQTFK
jgi:hypothetical protein